MRRASTGRLTADGTRSGGTASLLAAAAVALVAPLWWTSCDGRSTPTPICPDGDPVAHLQLVNKSQRRLYVDDVGFQTLQNGRWVVFSMEHACPVLCHTCENPCDGGCEPRSYAPCPPGLLPLSPDESAEIVWDGTIYVTGERGECTCEGNTVSCVRQTRASSGRYRITFCRSTEYEEIADFPCLDGPGPLPGMLKDPQCTEIEFAYDGSLCADGAVEIPIQ